MNRKWGYGLFLFVLVYSFSQHALQEVDDVAMKGSDDVDIEKKSQESVQLVKNAVQHFLKVPVAQACNDFISNNVWRKGELFVFVFTQSGVCLAYGDNQERIWQNHMSSKGIGGDSLIHDMLAVGPDGGSINYLWDNGYQTAYIQIVVKEGKTYILGCGFYPENDEYTSKQLVRTAAAYFYQNGKEAMFSLVSNPNGPFIKGDIYMFVYTLEGICVAHGNNAALIGQNLIDLQDTRGKPVIRTLIDIAKTKGKGWAEYYWRNEHKRAYVEKIVDPKTNTEYLVSAGYYPNITFEAIKNYVNKAIRFLKANGAKVAFGEFSNVVGEFSRAGLGIFVFDEEGKCLANGETPGFVGQNLMKIKSQDGRLYVKDMIEQAIKNGTALLSYVTANANAVGYVQYVETPDGKYIVGAEFFPSTKTTSTQTLVNRAVNFLLEHEPEYTFGVFSQQESDFIRGDLSIFVYEEDGTRLVNGSHKKEIWKNLEKATDQQGKMVIGEIITVALNGGGWSEYRTRNAVRKVYVKAVAKKVEGDTVKNYIVGSGYFL